MSQKKKTICSAVGFLCIAAVIVCAGELVPRTSMFRTVLQLGAIYALLAVSMNLCNGFTGLFSLGQAGFMTLGAYTYAIFTIPTAARPGVYYLYGVADWLADLHLPIIAALLAAGVVGALFAALIGAPVLKLKSDYLAWRRSALRRLSASLSPPRRSTALRTALSA